MYVARRTVHVMFLLLQAASGEGGHRVSYGYYRAFNVMLDHAQVLHDMAIKAAKGNRYRELEKGKLVNTNVKLLY